MTSCNQPLGGNAMPRFGGPGTMMRLPAAATAAGLDVAFVGVPFDIGTSNRSGTRMGPRQIRQESCMVRPYNMATRAAPSAGWRSWGSAAASPPAAKAAGYRPQKPT